jgi:ABC-type lipoprotein export system ATPase subunit
VHTPESVVQHYGDREQEATWSTYLDALESLPPEFKAIAVTDYASIEGYRRLKDQQLRGRLANLPLILPAVEVRLAQFAGSNVLRKINYHVIFSDDVTADEIESCFLRKLTVDLQLGTASWSGDIGTRDGLIALGEAVIGSTPADLRAGNTPLEVGFHSAAVEPSVIAACLEQTVFRGRVLTALGRGEWSDMRWEGGSAAQKRDAIERADFVLTACGTIAEYEKQHNRLTEHAVNAKLVHASDAHYYGSATEFNRLGQSLTWIKADLTFRGLRRALHRFDDRVYVGNLPPKLARIRNNKTKYITGITIKKKSSSSMTEKWFNSRLPLNGDLIAIIGNQGSGKSALTDIIALCGDSQVRSFSFLTSEKFCDRDLKAASFEAELTWEGGGGTKRSLDSRVDSRAAERVRYVPQSFFEDVTNETEVKEGGKFYGEIKKAIFSHVPIEDRLGRNTLDDLVDLRTKGVAQALELLRSELSHLNRDIAQLEAECAESEILRLENDIAKKEEEIATLRGAPPREVQPATSHTAEYSQIAVLQEAEKRTRTKLDEARQEQAVLKRRHMTLLNARRALDTAAARLEAAVHAVQTEFDTAGIDLTASSLLSASMTLTPITEALEQTERRIDVVSAELNEKREGSTASKALGLERERRRIESVLQNADRDFEAFRQAERAWGEALQRLEGKSEMADPSSLVGLRARLLELQKTKPSRLAELGTRRRKLCERIIATLADQCDVYRSVTGPVQTHIQSEELTREKYRLTVEVALLEHDLAERLFGMVNQSSGTFSGLKEGRQRLRDLVNQADFRSIQGVVAFADGLLQNLNWNTRHDPPTRCDPTLLLKKGFQLNELYDLIFKVEYLRPTFALSLNGKPLRQLSPGERGILLLVFYLLVDRGDEPLVIDQPEGNLNNQSIFEHLVPVFRAAKERRQIIMVTHNPNLAVVCDAEQIVHCFIDFSDGNRVDYTSGALENPIFNRLSLDLLEGTSEAFGSRSLTYEGVVTKA